MQIKFCITWNRQYLGHYNMKFNIQVSISWNMKQYAMWEFFGTDRFWQVFLAYKKSGLAGRPTAALQFNPNPSSIDWKSCKSRREPNRGYKESNPNPNILSLIFVSYNRIRIVQKGIRFLINRIPNTGFLYSF